MTVVHHHHEQHSHRMTKVSRLRLALILTAGGMAIEFAGGILSNSLALISDAWHMLTHLFALGMSYFAAMLALRPATKARTYGYFRAEVLAAFVNGLALVAIAIFIGYEAVQRFMHPERIRVAEMLLTAAIGLVINGASIGLLFKSSSHDMNIKSAILHELGDILSSVAVVAGGIAMLYTNNVYIDSGLGLFISALIFVWAYKLIIDSGHILLESTPRHLDIDELAAVLKKEVPGVKDMTHIHVWTISSSMYALTASVTIDDCKVSQAAGLLEKINTVLKDRFHIGHTNIQFECKESKEP